MRRRLAGLLGVVLAGGLVAAAPRPGAQESEPTFPLREDTRAAADYVRHPLRGFDVRVTPELTAEGTHADLGQRALDALERDLAAVVDRVPEAATAKLREVPLFLSFADPVSPCACYHPSPIWLESHGYDPAKGRAVELCSAERYLEYRTEQPSLVLHELAHALHDRHLRAFQPEIEAAFERVTAAGAYDEVLRASGHTDRHYALTNVSEYFAETSEALFGVNDFWPFVRAELTGVDPEGARLLTRLWKR